jgi:hypothetical protein
MIQSALDQKLINASEAQQLTQARTLQVDLIGVDSFDPEAYASRCGA